MATEKWRQQQAKKKQAKRRQAKKRDELKQRIEPVPRGTAEFFDGKKWVPEEQALRLGVCGYKPQEMIPDGQGGVKRSPTEVKRLDGLRMKAARDLWQYVGKQPFTLTIGEGDQAQVSAITSLDDLQYSLAYLFYGTFQFRKWRRLDGNVSWARGSLVKVNEGFYELVNPKHYPGEYWGAAQWHDPNQDQGNAIPPMGLLQHGRKLQSVSKNGGVIFFR